MELNKKYFTGRALDNRMGGFMIAEVVKRLSENKKKLTLGSMLLIQFKKR